MYEIRYYQDWSWSKRYVLLATCATIDEARALLGVSGDLVVEASTNVVVSDPRWLWDWEKTEPKAYARNNLGLHRPGTIAGPFIELFGRYGILPQEAP
jgi:hypothetical protein